MLKHIAKFLFLCLMIITYTTQAQPGNIYHSAPKIPKVRLYFLNNEQALFAINNNHKLDTQILYTTLAKTWDYDSFQNLRQNVVNRYNQQIDEYSAQQLGIKKHGYYLLVSDVTEDGRAYVSLLDYPYYKCKVQKLDNETLVWVSDYHGQMVQNVEVSLADKNAVWVPGLGAYKLVNKELQGDIWIRGNGEFGYHKLINYSNVQVSKRSAPPADKYKYKKQYDGYIATNKPLYKRGDTIWWKAYLTKPNGKGLRKPIKMWLNAYSPAGYSAAIMGKPIQESQVAKPIKRGAYEGFFVANDTFPLNTTYKLNAYKANNSRFLKQHTFEVQDYEKANWQLALAPSRNEYQPNETPQLNIQTLDKNGLPLLGAYLEINVRLAQLFYAEQDSVQVNRKWYDTFYNIRMLAHESGNTEVPIPKELFVAAQAQYNVWVNVSNSDFNQSTLSCNFSTTTNRNRAISRIENDSLIVNYYYNQQLASNRFKVSMINLYYFKEDTVLTSPIKLAIPAYISSVEVTSLDTTFAYQARINTPMAAPRIWGNRGYDSIAVHLRSTNGQKVYYQLYSNNNLIKEGSDTAMDYVQYDASKNSYHLRYIQFGHIGIAAEVQQQSFHFAEKNLLITSNLNKTAYPNQWNEVLITVLKGNRKPAKNVNLTAYAVNKQLPVLQAPHVPYLGLIKPQKTMQKTNLSTQFCGLRNVPIALRPWMIDGFELRKQNFFTIQYPKTGVQVYTDTIADTTTQVQFIVYKGAISQDITALFNFNTLWYSDVYNRQSEVIAYNQKTMALELFTNELKLNIGKINITPHCKNFVCIQIDSLPENKITKYEDLEVFQDSINTILVNHTLFYTINGNYYDTLIIKQNGTVKQAYTYNKYRPFKVLWGEEKRLDAYGKEISKSNQMQFLIYGPMRQFDKIEINYKRGFGHEFNFTPMLHLYLPKTHKTSIQ